MTTSYNLVGVGPATNLNDPNARIASILGRVSPMKRDDVSGWFIQPYVLPWTEVTDTVGEPYPAGIVAVVGEYAVATTDPYPGQIDDYFADNSRLVPAVLPSGYTPRLERDCYFDPGIVGQALVNDYVGIYRDANGPVTTLWQPVHEIEARGYLSTVSINQLNATPPFYHFGDLLSGVGLRAYKYRMTWQYLSFGSGPHPGWPGSLEIQISHNADGTNPGTDSGDTVDHTHSFSFGDFTFVGPNFLGIYTYTSNEVNVGPLMPSAIGVVTHFKIRLDFGTSTNVANPSLAGKYSPNLDVPFVFTATGDGGLIAPGGVVT